VPSVYVFVSTGRFSSFEQMREYIDMTYSEDGEAVDSVFIREVGLESYEPACIEAITSKSGVAVAISELLLGSSWADQWIHRLPAGVTADSAICVFDPNRLRQPNGCTLEYLGEFDYEVRHPDWFKKLVGETPNTSFERTRER
jgi:Immunity protein 22